MSHGLHILPRCEQNKNNRNVIEAENVIQDAGIRASPAHWRLSCDGACLRTVRDGSGVFSIILATRDSERALVPTLAALVPGATAGIVREVIVTDDGSRDQTQAVADVAGCHFLVSTEPLGARLAAAARGARGDWLMFLQPGAVPAFTWIDETIAFADKAHADIRAAVFADAPSVRAALRRKLLLPRARQGLILRKSVYQELGGHRADVADPEAALLRLLGRARLTTLRSTVSFPDI